MGNESGEWIMHGVDWNDPGESWQKIADHMHKLYPAATDRQIRKLLK